MHRSGGIRALKRYQAYHRRIGGARSRMQGEAKAWLPASRQAGSVRSRMQGEAKAHAPRVKATHHPRVAGSRYDTSVLSRATRDVLSMPSRDARPCAPTHTGAGCCHHPQDANGHRMAPGDVRSGAAALRSGMSAQRDSVQPCLARHDTTVRHRCHHPGAIGAPWRDGRMHRPSGITAAMVLCSDGWASADCDTP